VRSISPLTLPNSAPAPLWHFACMHAHMLIIVRCIHASADCSPMFLLARSRGSLSFKTWFVSSINNSMHRQIL
jgi:hypothetical protein